VDFYTSCTNVLGLYKHHSRRSVINQLNRLSHGCFHIGPISSPLSTTALSYTLGSYQTFGLDIRADTKTDVW